ncbi:hypothetical protein [Alkalihalobacillus sp. TS-13]|uniref:hypothetical protein n=1 Tax=Alkalihalobacillus sp. TS-13 TaxID=2842455 RepID=UPI001C868576|nr:hypothetical protein [Alkalihalobacillus sp. TS-13]
MILPFVIVLLFTLTGCVEKNEINQEKAEILAIEALENDYEEYIENKHYLQQFAKF